MITRKYLNSVLRIPDDSVPPPIYIGAPSHPKPHTKIIIDEYTGRIPFGEVIKPRNRQGADDIEILNKKHDFVTGSEITIRIHAKDTIDVGIIYINNKEIVNSDFIPNTTINKNEVKDITLTPSNGWMFENTGKNQTITIMNRFRNNEHLTTSVNIAPFTEINLNKDEFLNALDEKMKFINQFKKIDNDFIRKVNRYITDRQDDKFYTFIDTYNDQTKIVEDKINLIKEFKNADRGILLDKMENYQYMQTDNDQSNINYQQLKKRIDFINDYDLNINDIMDNVEQTITNRAQGILDTLPNLQNYIDICNMVNTNPFIYHITRIELVNDKIDERRIRLQNIQNYQLNITHNYNTVFTTIQEETSKDMKDIKDSIDKIKEVVGIYLGIDIDNPSKFFLKSGKLNTKLLKPMYKAVQENSKNYQLALFNDLIIDELQNEINQSDLDITNKPEKLDDFLFKQSDEIKQYVTELNNIKKQGEENNTPTQFYMKKNIKYINEFTGVIKVFNKTVDKKIKGLFDTIGQPKTLKLLEYQKDIYSYFIKFKTVNKIVDFMINKQENTDVIKYQPNIYVITGQTNVQNIKKEIEKLIKDLEEVLQYKYDTIDDKIKQNAKLLSKFNDTTKIENDDKLYELVINIFIMIRGSLHLLNTIWDGDGSDNSSNKDGNDEGTMSDGDGSDKDGDDEDDENDGSGGFDNDNFESKNNDGENDDNGSDTDEEWWIGLASGDTNELITTVKNIPDNIFTVVVTAAFYLIQVADVPGKEIIQEIHRQLSLKLPNKIFKYVLSDLNDYHKNDIEDIYKSLSKVVTVKYIEKTNVTDLNKTTGPYIVLNFAGSEIKGNEDNEGNINNEVYFGYNNIYNTGGLNFVQKLKIFGDSKINNRPETICDRLNNINANFNDLLTVIIKKLSKKTNMTASKSWDIDNPDDIIIKQVTNYFKNIKKYNKLWDDDPLNAFIDDINITQYSVETSSGMQKITYKKQQEEAAAAAAAAAAAEKKQQDEAEAEKKQQEEAAAAAAAAAAEKERKEKEREEKERQEEAAAAAAAAEEERKEKKRQEEAAAAAEKERKEKAAVLENERITLLEKYNQEKTVVNRYLQGITTKPLSTAPVNEQADAKILRLQSDINIIKENQKIIQDAFKTRILTISKNNIKSLTKIASDIENFNSNKVLNDAVISIEKINQITVDDNDNIETLDNKIKAINEQQKNIDKKKNELDKKKEENLKLIQNTNEKFNTLKNENINLINILTKYNDNVKEDDKLNLPQKLGIIKDNDLKNRYNKQKKRITDYETNLKNLLENVKNKIEVKQFKFVKTAFKQKLTGISNNSDSIEIIKAIKSSIESSIKEKINEKKFNDLVKDVKKNHKDNTDAKMIADLYTQKSYMRLKPTFVVSNKPDVKVADNFTKNKETYDKMKKYVQEEINNKPLKKDKFFSLICQRSGERADRELKYLLDDEKKSEQAKYKNFEEAIENSIDLENRNFKNLIKKRENEKEELTKLKEILITKKKMEILNANINSNQKKLLKKNIPKIIKFDFEDVKGDINNIDNKTNAYYMYDNQYKTYKILLTRFEKYSGLNVKNIIKDNESESDTESDNESESDTESEGYFSPSPKKFSQGSEYFNNLFKELTNELNRKKEKDGNFWNAVQTIPNIIVENIPDKYEQKYNDLAEQILNSYIPDFDFTGIEEWGDRITGKPSAQNIKEGTAIKHILADGTKRYGWVLYSNPFKYISLENNTYMIHSLNNNFINDPTSDKGLFICQDVNFNVKINYLDWIIGSLNTGNKTNSIGNDKILDLFKRVTDLAKGVSDDFWRDSQNTEFKTGDVVKFTFKNYDYYGILKIDDVYSVYTITISTDDDNDKEMKKLIRHTFSDQNDIKKIPFMKTYDKLPNIINNNFTNVYFKDKTIKHGKSSPTKSSPKKSSPKKSSPETKQERFFQARTTPIQGKDGKDGDNIEVMSFDDNTPQKLPSPPSSPPAGTFRPRMQMSPRRAPQVLDVGSSIQLRF